MNRPALRLAIGWAFRILRFGANRIGNHKVTKIGFIPDERRVSEYAGGSRANPTDHLGSPKIGSYLSLRWYERVAPIGRETLGFG